MTTTYLSNDASDPSAWQSAMYAFLAEKHRRRYSGGPRGTQAFEIVRAAIDAHPKPICVTDDDKNRLMRLYKVMIQWQRRHASYHVRVRKAGLAFYVWLDHESGARNSGPSNAVVRLDEQIDNIVVD